MPGIAKCKINTVIRAGYSLSAGSCLTNSVCMTCMAMSGSTCWIVTKTGTLAHQLMEVLFGVLVVTWEAATTSLGAVLFITIPRLNDQPFVIGNLQPVKVTTLASAFLGDSRRIVPTENSDRKLIRIFLRSKNSLFRMQSSERSHSLFLR